MERILFFDGVCVLCHGFVNFLLKKDKVRDLSFSTLQGKTAKKILPAHLVSDLTTIVLWEENKIYTQSDAILKTLIELGGFYKILTIFYIVPKKIRDVFYNFISENRYKLFGKKSYCLIPSEKEKSRILE